MGEITRYKRNSEAAWQIIGDKAVVVSPGSRKIHILSGAARDIWDFLSAGRTVDEVSGFLKENYDLSDDTAFRDSRGFLNDSLKISILETEIDER
jgi:hypothetical protein